MGRGTPKHDDVQQVRPKAVAFVGFVCPSPRTRPGPGTGPAQPISGAHHVYIERESRWFRQIRLSWKQMNIPQGCVLQETPHPWDISGTRTGGPQPKSTTFHTCLHACHSDARAQALPQQPEPTTTAGTNDNSRIQRLWAYTYTHAPAPIQHSPWNQQPERAHKNRWFRLSASQTRDMRPTARRVGIIKHKKLRNHPKYAIISHTGGTTRCLLWKKSGAMT